MEFKELAENGQWVPVEVRQHDDVATGGVYQLKQGQQRRLIVGVAVPPAGGLPLGVDTITSVSIGCVCVRQADVHKALDSYQEEDLERLRSQWTDALKTRQKYLEEQLDKLSLKPGKSEGEKEREHSLMGQWVALTEERTAVSVPTPNSDIPGAPCDWNPPEGVENHIPVLFLDLNSDDMTGELTSDQNAPMTAGMHSILPKEHVGPPLILLPIAKLDENGTTATCSWDSSIHDHQALNMPTGPNERVYAIVKIGLRLSHPCPLDVIIRKRVCLNIYKKVSISLSSAYRNLQASFTERIMKKIVGTESLHRTSVFVDVVAHIPKVL